MYRALLALLFVRPAWGRPLGNQASLENGLPTEIRACTALVAESELPRDDRAWDYSRFFCYLWCETRKLAGQNQGWQIAPGGLADDRSYEDDYVPVGYGDWDDDRSSPGLIGLRRPAETAGAIPRAEYNARDAERTDWDDYGLADAVVSDDSTAPWDVKVNWDDGRWAVEVKEGASRPPEAGAVLWNDSPRTRDDEVKWDDDYMLRTPVWPVYRADE